MFEHLGMSFLPGYHCRHSDLEIMGQGSLVFWCNLSLHVQYIQRIYRGRLVGLFYMETALG